MRTGVLVLLVAVGGAVGAPARYLLEGAVQRRSPWAFPLGTLAVNVTGSLVLGVVTGLVLEHGLTEAPSVALGAGFCGAFTTFSSFAFETVRMARAGAAPAAALNVALSVGAALAAAALGLALTGGL